MPGTGPLNQACDDLVTSLAAITGLPVTRDPRNLTPGCVLVQAPTFEVISAGVYDLTIPCTLISSGPGNLDALAQLLTLSATVVGQDVAVANGRPMVLTMGGTDAPAYELTVRMKVQL